MNEKQLKQRKKIIVLSIISIVLNFMIYLTGLLIFIFTVLKKLNLPMEWAVIILIISIFTWVFGLLIAIFSLITFRKKMGIYSFVKIMFILCFFQINILIFIVVKLNINLKKSLSKNKHQDYSFITIKELRKKLQEII